MIETEEEIRPSTRLSRVSKYSSSPSKEVLLNRFLENSKNIVMDENSTDKSLSRDLI
jgi:hypothetical protein